MECRTLPCSLQKVLLVLVTLFISAVVTRAETPTEAEICDKGLVCFDSFWKHGKLVLAPWLVVLVASPLALLSALLVALGLLEIYGWVRPPSCCRSYAPVNVLALLPWPAVLAVSCWLLANGIKIMAVYIAWSGIAILIHAVVLVLYGYRNAVFKAQEPPRQQLLVNQGYSHRTTGGDEAPIDTNPFHATYGLIPGTSNFGYQIFIPADPSLEYKQLAKQPSSRAPAKPAASSK